MSDSPYPLFDPAYLTDQEQVRLQNLQTLIAAGVEPYPARVQRTHTIAEARALHAEGNATGEVSIAGRLKAFRNMGKGAQDLHQYVQAHARLIEKLYFAYTTCPSCAKAYGHNYVVAFAKVA